MKTALRWLFIFVMAAVIPACHDSKPDPPPPPPADPTNLVLTPVSTVQIRLDWTDNATNESFYLLDRSLDGVAFTQIAILSANTQTYSDRNLQPSTPYWYRITATNRGGNSASVSDVTFTMDLFWNGPTTGGPSTRAGHSAVYDGIGQRMIVFGGAGPGLQGDLWQLSLPDPTVTPPAWSPLATTGTPPTARTGHSAIFDSVNNRMILFGGQQAGPGPYLNEVWVLTLAGTPAWSPVTPSGMPPGGRRNHSAVYDPVRREMIVYGGTDDAGLTFDDFFVLSLPVAAASFTWSSPPVASFRPVGRHLHSAIHDPLGPRMVMLAGHDNDTVSDGSTLNGEAWTLHPGVGFTWVGLSFAVTPPLRAGHTAVYDALNQRMVIFGGYNDTLDPITPPDMWAMNLGSVPNWVLMSPGGPPAPTGRMNHTAVYDALYSRIVIFGGRTGVISYSDELWWITP